jgi:hypothetical protein
MHADVLRNNATNVYNSLENASAIMRIEYRWKD